MADCRFDSVRLYADRMTAVVQVQTVVWDKRISGNPEQGFSVELPVNRDTITATMKKENGVWKLDSIDSQISLSAYRRMMRFAENAIRHLKRQGRRQTV